MNRERRKAKAAGTAHTRCARRTFSCHQRRQQGGMTLVELLVVIVILAVVTAAALPVLTPSTTERRIREASRELNTLLSKQQATAIRTQRLAGIALKRLSSETGRAEDRGVCIEIVPVEQPAPYAGFDENSRMRVALRPNDPNVWLEFITRGADEGPTSDGLPTAWDSDLVPPGLIRIGDVVEILNNRYRILGSEAPMTVSNGYLSGHDGSTPQPARIVAQPVNNTGQVIHPTYDSNGARLSAAYIASGNSNALYWTEPAPYKILRQPTPSTAAPLQLPSSIAVDLEASGMLGEVPFHVPQGFNGGVLETWVDSAVYLMFSPDGNVERVQYQYRDNDDNVLTRLIAPSSSIALLVGRRELIPAETSLNLTSGSETEIETEKSKLNWLNLESRWVVIGAQTGTVTTSENAFVNTSSLATFDFDGNGDTPLNQRRTQIQAAQEFAREMRRIGGS